ncbi:MAG: response regulator [Chlorobi bacterium]|nr:response regulator [Chlorobiota bacterium]
MFLSGYIRKCLDEGTRISRFNVTWGVLLAAPGHLFFYFLLKYGFLMPYESFALRFAGSLLALFALLLVRLDSPTAKRIFPYYWHFTLIFVLPFIFTFYLLKNDFHELWLYWEIFMVFVLIAFVPNWLMLLFDLVIGVLAAVAVFMLTSPGASLNPDFDIAAYATVLSFCLVAGYLFSYSNRKGQVALEKNAALQALAGSIAHEMRNPLSQVRLNLDIIEHQLPSCGREDNGKSADLQENIIKVLDSLYQHVAWCQIAVRRGSQIITMILDEVSEKPISKNSFIHASAGLTTRKAIEEYGFESSSDRKKIMFDSSRDFMFRVNETMYMFVLFNLLKNALYVLESRPEAKIHITIEPGETLNRVKVRDTGPGIPEVHLKRLFDPYYTSGKKGGTGLGLSYCKRVMQAFSGDITCNSLEGAYTEFVLEFPVVSRDQLQASLEGLISENRELLGAKRILVVDDREQDRKDVRRVLGEVVAFLDEAADGREAIAKLRNASCDLVIMNLSMPVLDGYEATELIRQGEAGESASTVPVLGYTEQPYAVVHARTIKAGMQGLLAKPCSDEELIIGLAEVFRELKGIKLQRLQGTRVLIVDDSSVNRIGLAMMLEKYGMQTEAARNGKDALEKIESVRFDLVLMDIGMPIVDGIEATRRIRKSPKEDTAVLPVIGISGESDEQLVREALSSGMNDYVVKPVDIRVLAEKISNLL